MTPSRSASGAGARRALAGVLFAALSVGLACAAMVVSFLVVRHLAGPARGREELDPAVLQRARILRGFSNELVTLCNDYHRRFPAGMAGAGASNRQWADRVFRRDLQFLQDRIDAILPDTLPEYVNLRAAVHRCAAMARHPGDQLLREQTLREVARATEAIEAHLRALGAEVKAGPPRVRPRFGGDAAPVTP
ncbi:MAG: hypothetical protein KF886_16655 [Candidatus Hydrogenedentes bacterium]|nr:hypothetical protein [Candidatus Hydrogenedentota bacterium]